MAFEEDVLDIPLLAGEIMYSSSVNYQYHFVKLSDDNTVVHCTGASDLPIGVLQNKPTAIGQIARVRVYGVSRVYTGTAGITLNNKVGTDASGHGINKTVSKTIYAGVALETSASTETCKVMLFGQKTISA